MMQHSCCNIFPLKILRISINSLTLVTHFFLFTSFLIYVLHLKNILTNNIRQQDTGLNNHIKIRTRTSYNPDFLW